MSIQENRYLIFLYFRGQKLRPSGRRWTMAALVFPACRQAGVPGKPRRLIARVAPLFLGLFLFFPLNIDLWAQSPLVIDVTASKSAWEKDILTDRKVIFTNKSFEIAEIQTDIPTAGKYQLFAYAHHNWRQATVRIYAEAVDSEGIIHKGYHKIENIWYLSQEAKGRWFFISLTQDPYWNLPKGRLQLKFWVAGNDSPHGNTIVPMESRVSIENFFLIPVEDYEGATYLPGVIYPETGEGSWNIISYHQKYATNLIETNRNGSVLSCKTTIPVPGHYQIWFSVLSPLNNSLEITVKNEASDLLERNTKRPLLIRALQGAVFWPRTYKAKKHKFNIKLNGKEEWMIIPTQTLYLDKGTHSIILKKLGSNQIMIDFFMILPLSEEVN